MVEKFSRKLRHHFMKRRQSKLSLLFDQEVDNKDETTTEKRKETSFMEKIENNDADTSTHAEDTNEAMENTNETGERDKNNFSAEKEKNRVTSSSDEIISPLRFSSPDSSYNLSEKVIGLNKRIEYCEKLLSQKDLVIQQQSEELQSTRVTLQEARQQSQKYKQRAFDIHQKFLRWNDMLMKWAKEEKPPKRPRNDWPKLPRLDSIEASRKMESQKKKINTVTPARKSLKSSIQCKKSNEKRTVVFKQETQPEVSQYESEEGMQERKNRSPLLSFTEIQEKNSQKENKDPNIDKKAQDSELSIKSPEKQTNMNCSLPNSTQGSETQLHDQSGVSVSTSSDRSSTTKKSSASNKLNSMRMQYKSPLKQTQDESQALIGSKQQSNEGKSINTGIKRTPRSADRSSVQFTREPMVRKHQRVDLRAGNKNSAIKANSGWQSNRNARLFMEDALDQKGIINKHLSSTNNSKCDIPEDSENAMLENPYKSLKSNAAKPQMANPSHWLQKKKKSLPQKVQAVVKGGTYKSQLSQQPAHNYVEVVRGKKKRQCLPGHSCPECDAFWGAVCDGNDIFSQKHFEDCSRHRSRNRPSETPEDFWELSFIDEKREREAKEKQIQTNGKEKECNSQPMNNSETQL